ncbi:MAG TPA: UDP-N-acetylmuramoyl-tripeptide--D-alanyl-D-alanine ligase [Candidatus Binataceae bacterium]|nr:UDP-N-acetylmuramoyl-tripeptide--D-alanyl-D-alanine ligase [Candidatus Binataceae bacterium]
MATPIPANRCAFSLGEAAAALGAVLRSPDPARRATSVSIDTRTLAPGAIFVALRGVADGHAFLARAAERGAAAAIVEHGRAFAGLDCLEVADPLEALGRLAHAHLERVRAARRLQVISIGGAAGKTTTKELTATAARAIIGPTLATPGNLNNLIGVPMTIFTLTAEHRAAVLECGTNTRGEIARLGAIVAPDAAMVLNAALEHSEGLGTLEEIAAEEAAMFAAARRCAILPAGDAILSRWLPEHLRAITFGPESGADLRVADRTPLTAGSGARITLALNPALIAAGANPILTFETRLLGPAAALNCAAALAAVAALSPAPITTAQLEAVGALFAAAAPIARRMAPLELGGALILDDSYNAQPPSMRVAIATAHEVAAARAARLIVVLGDMLELGALAPAAHDETVRQALDAGAAIFIAVGPEMSAALERAVRGVNARCHTVAAPESHAAAEMVRGLVRPGDVVLVKGSLGMAMDRVIDLLRANLPHH